MGEKHFSRHEAEELLPMIREFLEQAREQKKAVDALQGELSQAATRVMMLGGSSPPYADLVKKKSECDLRSAQIVETIAKIQQAGCLVKDIDEGLVDFPSLANGQEIYLCWKLGEERIGWWHGIEEGFAGRKPLDDSPAGEPPPPRRVH